MAIKEWTGSAYRDIAGVRGGNLPGQKGWIWDGAWRQVWANFAAMRMVKTGTQNTGSAWAVVNNMSEDPAYPATVVSSNKLVLKAGSGIITAQYRYSGATSSRQIAFQMQINDMYMGTAEYQQIYSSGSYGTSTWPYTASDGDTLTLHAAYAGGWSGTPKVTAGTYVSFDPA